MTRINNDLPNGWVLKLRQSCSFGEHGKIISTHATYNEAEVKAKNLNYALTVFEILDIYGNKTLTARST